jgi:hypothetical protein
MVENEKECHNLMSYKSYQEIIDISEPFLKTDIKLRESLERELREGTQVHHWN